MTYYEITLLDKAMSVDLIMYANVYYEITFIYVFKGNLLRKLAQPFEYNIQK